LVGGGETGDVFPELGFVMFGRSFSTGLLGTEFEFTLWNFLGPPFFTRQSTFRSLFGNKDT